MSEDNLLNPAGAGGDNWRSLNKKKRVEVPSSRKFTAQFPKSSSSQLQLKLYDAIENESGGRAASVDGSTPSKTKKLVRKKVCNKLAVIATPRFDEELTPRCKRSRAACNVYQRLLLCVWRRSRESLATLTESSRRRDEQINGLQIKIEVLKELQLNESKQRDAVAAECKKVKKDLEIVELEKAVLLKDVFKLEQEVMEGNKSVGHNEEVLNRYEEQMMELMDKIKGLRDENEALKDKVGIMEQLDDTLQTLQYNLQEELRTTSEQLKASQDLNQLNTERLDEQLMRNTILQNELAVEKLELIRMTDSCRNLERIYADCEKSLSILKEENWIIKGRMWMSLRGIGWKAIRLVDSVLFKLLPVYRTSYEM